ncbi:helix-turn-helix domain-containing protein [Caulobacter sp. BP25]|uniref:helix-turn-helix domain-containing protein n=1 Tax=Caulobacter sp. BP25 TaxID=2048900 RepID=UPI000C12DA24|nr:helix-turn-helix domain-containing protein [Caulobacter sp. BP25]PHY20905.1 transcriptional regulator [Caulobacter sp. BP25]
MAFDDTSDARTQPEPVDKHVGARIRLRRKLLGLSQTHLGDALGLTFQQVQKYERGDNRVSASKLYDTAKALQVPIAYFFEGLGDPLDPDAAPTAEDPVLILASLPHGLALARALQAIGSRERGAVLGLVELMARDSAGQGEAIDGEEG